MRNIGEQAPLRRDELIDAHCHAVEIAAQFGSDAPGPQIPGRHQRAAKLLGKIAREFGFVLGVGIYGLVLGMMGAPLQWFLLYAGVAMLMFVLYCERNAGVV